MTTEYSFVPGMKSLGGKKMQRANVNEAIGMLLTGPWAGVLRFDTFRGCVTAANPPLALDAEKTKLSDADLIAIAAWFAFKCRIAGTELVAQAAVIAARRNPYHPILDYLGACQSGGSPLLDTLASRVFGCPPGIADEFLKRTLVGAVRRLRRPGCQMDTTLVICGKQGIRKSSFVRLLFGNEVTRSQMPDLSSKDASLALAGFWAVELAELDRIIRAETSTTKEFLTRTYDDYRAPYAKVDERHDRRCVFVGTTNDLDFLRDATGNRRYWPIIAEKVDVDFVAANRDAIWAEAIALEAAGFPHWFDEADETRAEEQRQAHVTEDPWHERIADYCRGQGWVHSEDLYDEAIAGGDVHLIARKTRREAMRVVDTLKRLGCTRGYCKDRKGWRVPSALFSEAPSHVERGRRAVLEARRSMQNLANSLNGPS